MTNRRPTPLKDEPVDELQELLAANLDAIEKLHKALQDRSNTQSCNRSELKEVVAAAASNAVRELLEQRQRNFEREEKETRAQGKLTPQECYSRLATDYADMLEKYRMVCKAYEYIIGIVKYLNGTRDNYDARIRAVDAKLDAMTTKKPKFPSCPKRLRELPAFIFKDIPLYFLRQEYQSRLVRQLAVICLVILLLAAIGIYL